MAQLSLNNCTVERFLAAFWMIIALTMLALTMLNFQLHFTEQILNIEKYNMDIDASYWDASMCIQEWVELATRRASDHKLLNLNNPIFKHIEEKELRGIHLTERKKTYFKMSIIINSKSA